MYKKNVSIWGCSSLGVHGHGPTVFDIDLLSHLASDNLAICIDIFLCVLESRVAFLPFAGLGFPDRLLFLVKIKIDECSDNHHPVQAVTGDRADGRGIVPAENRVEYLPVSLGKNGVMLLLLLLLL